ncbi:MAG TPA: RNA polymerase sigma factor [Candidatus Binataceae bacterium]|nr:RNA polymerase sigma factor [Candidatus Binataceae bacterium]
MRVQIPPKASVPGPLPDGWNGLYRDHHERILRLCRVMLADEQSAQEITQEVFLRSYQRMAVGEQPLSWGAWLTRVAANACRDVRRSAWCRRLSPRVELEEIPLEPGHDTPEHSLERQELCRRVWQQCLRLPRRQREVLVLRRLEQWPIEEVAEALGLSEGAVKRHLFRALQRLRKVLVEG